MATTVIAVALPAATGEPRISACPRRGVLGLDWIEANADGAPSGGDSSAPSPKRQAFCLIEGDRMSWERQLVVSDRESSCQCRMRGLGLLTKIPLIEQFEEARHVAVGLHKQRSPTCVTTGTPHTCRAHMFGV